MDDPRKPNRYLDLVEEQRRTFRDDFRTNSSEKDKIVIAVSGGALATSVAFLSNRPAPVWNGLLIAALAFFGAAVSFVLGSLHANSGQIARCIRYIDEWKKSPVPPGPPDGAYKIRIGKHEMRLVDALNALSILALIAGVGLMIAFVALNLH
jgi:hypothetical protein